ncbi:cytochrome b/b6 domain-containing protein [Rhodohalobacter sp. 614A]|jgi:cytochrome b|uniref:cytochrome b/b6 domain-containing protein n=1 Tax=Rhodohalobacter sp. 614A TaxID=2908649 RepID=UPI001F412879|nr:cytochrome b/b6 domain-containing protein [Rhodohalobacter sp. 614A]
MKKTTVYDWPTRIFHWLFAFLFLGAYLIAEIVDDENPVFTLHMLAGLTIGFILILRIIWGFIGTTYARFSSFKLNPIEFIQYLKDAVVAKTKRYLGHNPASSYAALVMFICAAGLAITGVMMTSGGESDFYEETHELLANIFLITVIVHVGGIIFHHLKHRDSLWSSMIDGKKQPLPEKTGITNSKRFAGMLFLILTLMWSGYLYSKYDSTNQTIDLFGQELVLGEEEHESTYEGEVHEDENND